MLENKSELNSVALPVPCYRIIQGQIPPKAFPSNSKGFPKAFQRLAGPVPSALPTFLQTGLGQDCMSNSGGLFPRPLPWFGSWPS